MEYVAIEVSLSHHLIPTMDFVWTKQLVHGYEDVAHSRNLPNLNKNNKQAGVVSVVVIVMDVVVIALGVVSIVWTSLAPRKCSACPSARLYLG